MSWYSEGMHLDKANDSFPILCCCNTPALLLTFCIDLLLHSYAHRSLISAHLYQINLVTSPQLSLYFCVMSESSILALCHLHAMLICYGVAL